MKSTDTNGDDARRAILNHLAAVKDPEIPVLDVVEMGIVRDVEVDDDQVCVLITPTYSGCPAMRVIAEEIVAVLNDIGYDKVSTRTVFSPPWTTEWLSEASRNKLKAYGISPPQGLADAGKQPHECPFCSSTNTELRSAFGSTPCKALHFCNDCSQPFEGFKCI